VKPGGLVYSIMSRSPSVSVVITTYNRSEALVQVLRGLALQDDRDFEIVVADDGSTAAHQQRIRAAASELGLRVTHVWHPDIGFTAARIRNRGVAAATGAYIILLDGDCVPETDFISQHRLLLEPGCFVNGSRVMLNEALARAAMDGSVLIVGRSPWFWLRQRLRGAAGKLTGLIRLGNGVGRKLQGFAWKGIRSCNMAVWRKDYLAVNGFDESFVGWGHEDADFVLRLHNAGIQRKNGFCATEVYHLWHRESSRSSESDNAARVRQRMVSGDTQPTLGYSDSVQGADVVVQRWG